MTTFPVTCPCCGQSTEAQDAGFSATTVEVAACDTQRASGIVSYTIRKSEALARAATYQVVRHSAGLEWFS